MTIISKAFPEMWVHYFIYPESSGSFIVLGHYWDNSCSSVVEHLTCMQKIPSLTSAWNSEDPLPDNTELDGLMAWCNTASYVPRRWQLLQKLASPTDSCYLHRMLWDHTPGTFWVNEMAAAQRGSAATMRERRKPFPQAAQMGANWMGFLCIPVHSSLCWFQNEWELNRTSPHFLPFWNKCTHP